MNNSELQQMELEAVSSIVGESNLFFNESTKSGWMKIDVNVPPEGIQVRSSQNEVTTFEHLPSITLSFLLQNGYPCSSPPKNLQVICGWLSFEQKTKLCERLEEIWEREGKCEILYNYYDYLQNECLSDLSENDQLILQHDNEYQELCESFEAIKIYCDESSAKEELRNNITCGICFDCHSSFESTFLEVCDHSFCIACLKEYIESRIGEKNVDKLQCPTCSTELLHSQIEKLIDDELFRKYDELLLEVALKGMQDVKFCPKPKCGHQSIMYGDGIHKCCKCHFVFCGYCELAYHGESPCKDLSNFQNDDVMMEVDIITDESFKYDLRKLESTSDEFILVKTFYDTTKNSRSRGVKLPEQNFQICKVIDNTSITTVKENSNNLMLFHGTNRKGATAILKQGFKNSEKGWFGKGIYMTDCATTARGYSCVWQSKKSKKYNSIFVNEVLESEKLQTFEFDICKPMKDIDTPLKNQFNKHIDKSSPQAKEWNYKKDRVGRKYRDVAHDYSSIYDEYVAEGSVTIPRYLILFEKELTEKTPKHY